MTFLRLSDAHMHQCLARAHSACFCVYLYITQMRGEVVHTDSRGHFGLINPVHSLDVLARTLFFLRYGFISPYYLTKSQLYIDLKMDTLYAYYYNEAEPN